MWFLLPKEILLEAILLCWVTCYKIGKGLNLLLMKTISFSFTFLTSTLEQF